MNTSLLEAFDDNRAALLAYISKRVHEPAQAEDLLHDLYLKLQSLSGATQVQYPKAYVYRMANNLVIDMQRRGAKELSLEQIELAESADDRDPQRHLEESQQLQIVTAAMAELPQKTRDVLQLQRIKQMQKSEVASELGVSVNMVEKHLRRALQHCRNRLFKGEQATSQRVIPDSAAADSTTHDSANTDNQEEAK